MTQVAAGLLSGLIFGVGLAISGMTDPAVVVGFLDVAGAWNPALMFVLAGAVVVTFIGYRLVQRRSTPLLAPRFSVPTGAAIDIPLLGGAALFGVGWGLAGYCPGPALASLLGHDPGTIVFVLAIVAGMIAVRLGRGALQRPA